MRNAALVGIFCLTSCLVLLGQSTTPAPDASQSANLPWDQSAITGCLQTTAGHYILRDDEGTVHELSGGARKLRPFVDRQVEIVGKKGTRSIDRTAAGGASTVVEIPIFEVKSVKQLADKCKLPGE